MKKALNAIATPVLLLIAILPTTAFASPAKNCVDEVKKLVAGLESALIDAEGYAQGDEPTEPALKLLASRGDNLHKYEVVVGHNNEDNETWKVTYQVTISKKYCRVETFRLVSRK